jgi:tRNA G18 (ribose-2'-O)-methylase SpoU
MITAVPLTDLNLPEITPYRTLRQSVEHFREGIVVVEGEKVVRRLVESPLRIISLLTTPEWLEIYKPFLQNRDESIIAYHASKSLLESIVGFHLHQGIMALAKIPQLNSLDKFISHASLPYLFVALDGLTNAENVGVVVRNCAAFGVQGIIVGETSSSPYLRRSVRNSMGTVFSIPVYHSPNLVETVNNLRSYYNCSIVAAHPHGVHSIGEVKFEQNLCIILGSEGEGISPDVLQTCDSTIAIPMLSGVDSLNVASAAAVFLYEIQRQRQFKFQSNFYE